MFNFMTCTEMKNQTSSTEGDFTRQPPEARSFRRDFATRHHIRNRRGEIEILSTAQVIAHANEVLQVVEFPANDLDALARGYVDVWNSAYPDQEVGIAGRVASDLIGDLVGYAFMLTRVPTSVEGV
jgi:hypothetical protein